MTEKSDGSQDTNCSWRFLAPAAAAA